MKNIKRLSFVMALVMIISSFAIALPITASAEVPVTDGVAVINETGVEYATLEDAIAAVANGQTIALLKDYVVESPSGLIIDRGITFTLDGMGHTLTNTVTTASPATGSLYAKSGTTTVKNLTINSTSGVKSFCGGVISRNTAMLILEDCNINVSGTMGYCAALANDGATLSFKGTNIMRASINGFWIRNGSTVTTIDGGKLIVVATGYSDAVTDAGITCVTHSTPLTAVASIGATAYTTIDEAVAAAASAGGTIELLCNSKVESTTAGLVVPKTSKDFTINGNGFKLSSTTSQAYRGTIYITGGTVTINDLTFDTQTSNAASWGAVLTNGSTAKAILNNCNVQVRGTAGVSAFGLNGSSTIEINNTKVVTTFGKLIHYHDANSKLVATNSTYTAPSLGISAISGLTLKQEAAIGETKYITLVDAFAAARQGDVITLLDDIDVVTEGKNGRIKCVAGGFDITLDGNGKKISSDSDVSIAFHYKATAGEDNGGVLRLRVKNLSVDNSAPSGSGATVQTNTSTNVTLEGCILHTKKSNPVGSVVVQPSSSFTAMGGTQILADTGIGVRLNDTAANATIHDASIVADNSVFTANKNTTLNVMSGAELTSRIATISGTGGGVINVTGGTIKTEATDTAVIVAPNANYTVNVFGGTFEGGNAILTNTADSKKDIAYSTSEAKETLLPAMTDGASVRVVTDASGIRFETTVPKNLLDHANAIKDAGTTVSYGTIITPKAYLNFTDGIFTMEALENSTLNGAKYQRIIATDGITDEEDGSISFRASLINIRLDNYKAEFAARGYVSYTVNGVTGYVYTDYADADNARSIYQVACTALADVSETSEGLYVNPVTHYLKLVDGKYTLVEGEAYSRFNTDQRNILNNYRNGVLNHVPGEEADLTDATLTVSEHLTDTFRQLGRGYIRNSGLACDFTCTGIEFNAYCAGSVYMKVNSSAATYWTVYVDGERWANRVLTNTSTTGWVELVYGLKAGDHRITIVKESQFTMSQNELLSVKVKGEFKEIPENKARFIEFYGDSILNGSNVYGGGTSPATSDGTRAFGWLTAQALEADCNVIGRGGLGVINTSSGGYCMLDIYDLNGARGASGVGNYDFTSRTPDAIVVELGINDKVQGGGVDEATYTDGVEQFVSAMRTKYGKDVPIVWLYGYSSSDYSSTMISAVKALQDAGDSNLYYCEVSPCNASDAYHPDVAKAETMAAEVTAHLKTILNIK